MKAIRNRRPALCLVAVFTVTSVASAGAPALEGLTDPPVAVYPDPIDLPEPPLLQANEEKLGHSLLALLNPTALLAGQTVADIKSEMERLEQVIPEAAADDGTPYGPVNSDLLRVEVQFEGIAPPATPGSLAGAHFFSWEEQVEWQRLFGWLEEDRLAAVAALPEVSGIHAIEPPQHRTAGGEGDLVMSGPTARSGYGFDGSVPLPGQNIRVGVISNGVTNLATAQAAGDLPPTVNTPLGSGSGDEGTAMLEIVHEIAPGAGLWFAPSGSNVNAHLNAATVLANTGCNIIVDDVGWYGEPYFEPGVLGPAFANLMAMHPQLLFFSAAGNDAETHQQMTYVDVASPSGYHDFPLWVFMPTGSSVDFYLQWNEPQNLPPTGNYQLVLFDNSSGSPVAWGGASPFPIRKLQYTNSGPASTFHLDVMAISGGGHTLELFMDPKNGANHYITHTSPVDAIFGHPGHPMIRAVSAVDYTTPTVIEFFASQGPWTQLGGTIGPKPDYTAPDGVSFSGAGGSHLPSYVGTTPPPYYFFGTSAAAPHVAGAAAVIWSSDPNLPPTAVETALAQGATDLGGLGMDNVYGHGRIDLLQSMIFQHGPLPPATVTATDGTLSDRVNLTWSSGTGADAYNVFASTTPNPATAVMISPAPGTATSYVDFEQPTGFAIRDQTIHYWIEPVNARFMSTGSWSAVESGYLQPSNLAPSITVPGGAYNAATRIIRPFGGVSVSDPDAGALPVSVTLASPTGILVVDTGVPGGVTPPQVANNSSHNVSLIAPMTAINTTLGGSDSVTYQSLPGIIGSQSVTCTVNDLGNTGWGGPLADSKNVSLEVHQTRFALWQYETFPADVGDPTKQATVWGRGANPDADLFTNEWEFFMNTDPMAGNAPGQMTHALAGGNFHLYARVGIDINPSSWTLERSPTMAAGTWGPAGASSSAVPHPGAPGDAMLWDLWVPHTPPTDFFRISFDPDFVEP